MPTQIFLSGRFDGGGELEDAFLKRTKCKHRCFTFAQMDKLNKHYSPKVTEKLAVCEQHGINIMMDSGAFSLHAMQAQSNKRTAKADIANQVDTHALGRAMFKRYVKYCLKNKSKWTFYVTLDFRKHQPTIYKMQQRFQRHGLQPTPVFHGDDSLDWLNRYSDMGIPLVALGTVKGVRSFRNQKQAYFYFDRVFNRAAKLGLNIHGLAQTSLSQMMAYPWWSVDSATWSKNAGFGIINVPNFEKGLIEGVHVSTNHSSHPHSYNNMRKGHRSQIDDMCKQLGFDIKLLRTSFVERHDFNGYVFSNLTSMPIDFTKRRSQWESLI